MNRKEAFIQIVGQTFGDADGKMTPTRWLVYAVANIAFLSIVGLSLIGGVPNPSSTNSTSVRSIASESQEASPLEATAPAPVARVDAAKAFFPPRPVTIKYESNDRSVKTTITTGMHAGRSSAATKSTELINGLTSQTSEQTFQLRDDGIYIYAQRITQQGSEPVQKIVDEITFPRYLSPGEQIEVGGFQWLLADGPINFEGWRLEPCVIGIQAEGARATYCHGVGLLEYQAGGIHRNIVAESAFQVLSDLESEGLIPASTYKSESHALNSGSISGMKIRLSLTPEANPVRLYGDTNVLKTRSANGTSWAVYFKEHEFKQLLKSLKNLICEGQHVGKEKHVNGVYSCFFVSKR